MNFGQVPVISTTRDPLTARLRVSTADRTEVQTANGSFFVGFSSRAAVPSGDTYYTVITAGAKVLVIEDLVQSLDFSAITDGVYIFKMAAHVEGSATSSFTYDVNAPTPIGRAMISSAINDFPLATIDLDVQNVVVTGDPEYPLVTDTFYIDTSGNRNTVAQSGAKFFDQNRQLILTPGTKALVVTTTSGGATGDANIETTFFSSEIDVSEFPIVLGVTV